MEIDSRGDYISVVTPMEGTPAYRVGLRPGDQIKAIDGESTYNMSTSDAASLMRGTAGTSVILTVMRSSFAEPIDFEVERAVIELKSVNYYGVIEGTDIGYIRLSRFAEETSNELREAISDLNKQDIAGLIFDLRSNGGGLLTQAVETAELFLNEGSLIVYTRGKNSRSIREHHSQRVPLYPDKPLVILVNEGTASASEIVSGAVQDWDRGVIMGYPTYGKGLVQQVFPVGNDNEIALKLTTAKYYIPSGRCIQKSETQQKREPGNVAMTQVDPAGEDSIEVEEKEIYYTNGGRPVYGGGGILPDVELEDEDYLGPLEINLERDRLFFDFAVKYVGENPGISTNIEITDEIIEDFRGFIRDKEFSYKTSLEVSLEEMKEIVTENGTDSLYGAVMDSFEEQINKEKEADFNKADDYLKRAVKRELVANIAGERGVYENVLLKTDKAIASALELIQDTDGFTEALSKGHLAATETSEE
jgi:carboxyl-terminal processing protease